MVDLLAGLRPVREVRVALRLGQIDHAAVGGDQAHQALADPQSRAVHGARAQAFRREQLEMLAAQDVRRADFRDDVGRDHAHHAIQAFLGADRGGHDLHQAAQQATGRAQLGAQPLHGGRRNRSTPAGGRDGHAALSAGADSSASSRASASAVCSTSSARISAIGCTWRTSPTL